MLVLDLRKCDEGSNNLALLAMGLMMDFRPVSWRHQTNFTVYEITDSIVFVRN
jgi:hypothetical protein